MVWTHADVPTFQACLRHAKLFRARVPGIENAGLLSDGPSGTCVGASREDSNGRARGAMQEVP